MRKILALIMILMLTASLALTLSACGQDRGLGGSSPGGSTPASGGQSSGSAGSVSPQTPSGANNLHVPSTDPGRRGSFTAIASGSEVLKNNIGTNDMQLVWFADECWYVIGYDGFGTAAARSGALTLLHTDVKGASSFNSDAGSPDANVFDGSALQGGVNAILAKGSNAIFHSREQCAVMSRSISGGSANYGEGGYDASLIKGGSVSALVWPLTAALAESVPPQARAAESGSAWWLCSPGEADSNAQSVGSDGSINAAGNTVTDSLGVRPAFDLEAGMILFSSSALNGKSSGPAGPDALSEVGRNDTGEWKLTLKDDGTNPQLTGHAGFSVDQVQTCDGSLLKIQYSGAATGSNEYISAIIIDGGGGITYYGRLAGASSSGTVSVNVGGKLSGGSLYLFNEQVNGDRATDYSSALKEISIPSDPHHNWQDATCTSPSTCSVCGATQGEALGHAWKDATCTEAKTCTRCGATDGAALGHAWEIRSCTEPRYCTRCGATESSAVGHDWKEATCTEPKTCKRCGATEGEALDHSWKAATCTEPKTCTRCGKTDGAALGHYWNEGAVTKEPTCEEKGVMTYTCKNDSSHTRTEEIKALGHVWGDWAVTRQPEVGVEGVEERTCSRCGIKEARAIPALKAYTVTFDSMGGDEIAPQTVIEKKTVERPADPARNGFTFSGWYTDSACTQAFDFTSPVTADTTLYAGWIEKGSPITPVYTAAEGAGGSWTKGSKDAYRIVVTRNMDDASCFSHYRETLIDGAAAEVSASSGSTVIEIPAETLEKLSAGTHNVSVRFDDGEARLTIEVMDGTPVDPPSPPTPPDPPSPDPGKDGGSGNLLWLILIPVVAIGAAAGFLIGRKRK